MKLKSLIFITTIMLGSILFIGGCHNHHILGGVPKWDECTKSSNWHGANANWRMMNVLSPRMSDGTFNQRVQFMKDRGCNTAHVILANKGDGEAAGYCIYGNNVTWTINKDYANVMTSRIKKLRKEKFAVVLWLITDDSSDWAKKLATNPTKYVNDIDSLGWFKEASTVCVGLELDEYWNANQVNSFIKALRAKYNGKIAVHHTSGKGTFAPLADLVFWQIDPTNDKNVIKNACKTALKYGKPVNMFETYRQENRSTSECALQNGCYAVGNW